MVFYIIASMIPGIEAPTQLIHWLMAFGVFAGANLLVIQFIKFFTIPKNILTYWLAGTMLDFGAFYLMSLFLPGITISETILDPMTLGFVSVNPYTLSPVMTMVLAALVAGLLSAVLYWLDSE